MLERLPEPHVTLDQLLTIAHNHCWVTVTGRRLTLDECRRELGDQILATRVQLIHGMTPEGVGYTGVLEWGSRVDGVPGRGLGLLIPVEGGSE